MRLNQYLARAGFGSRRACEQLILDGSVTINGHRLRELAVRVKPEDHVLVNGKPVKQPTTLVAALHKPVGYVCSSPDSTRDRTVFDLIPSGWPRVVYVGRLDKESEGLLLLTNDGELSQRLTHPSGKLPKTYVVTLNKEFDFSHASKLREGMMLEEGFGRMEEIFRVGPHTLKVVLTQGLKRQIRNMFFRLGYEVTRLVRVEIGGLSLEGLAAGHYRVLTKEEIAQIFKTSIAKRASSSRPVKSQEERSKPIKLATRRVGQTGARKPLPFNPKPASPRIGQKPSGVAGGQAAPGSDQRKRPSKASSPNKSFRSPQTRNPKPLPIFRGRASSGRIQGKSHPSPQVGVKRFSAPSPSQTSKFTPGKKSPRARS